MIMRHAGKFWLCENKKQDINKVDQKIAKPTELYFCNPGNPAISQYKIGMVMQIRLERPEAFRRLFAKVSALSGS